MEANMATCWSKNWAPSPPTVSLLWAASPLHLITHCVKWLSSIALHCQCCAAGDGWASFCPHRSSAETAHSHWRTWLFYWSSPCPLYCPLRPNYRPDIIRLSPGCRQSKNSAELWPLAVMPLRLSFIILTATTNRLRYQCRVYWLRVWLRSLDKYSLSSVYIKPDVFIFCFRLL